VLARAGVVADDRGQVAGPESRVAHRMNLREFGMRRFTAALVFLCQKTKAAVKRRTPNLRRHVVDAEAEPFLLHASSPAYLDGQAEAIRQRFRLRHDALDYLAMAGVVAGGLLLLVNALQLLRGTGEGDATPAVTALGLAVLLIAAGAYYVTSRHGAAAARLRMLDEGQILPGTIVACSGRQETTTEASLGEVTRAYLVSVEYRFSTPDGLEISDHDEQDRPDLRRAELPPAGAAVRVLYLDDETYALL
jgi:hypothetical protein